MRLSTTAPEIWLKPAPVGQHAGLPFYVHPQRTTGGTAEPRRIQAAAQAGEVWIMLVLVGRWLG
jgi:hypothetical protein